MKKGIRYTICIRFYFKFCCLDYASFFEILLFCHLWLYTLVESKEAFIFVDFYGHHLHHVKWGQTAFLFLVLAFFLLLDFFVFFFNTNNNSSMRTVRPGRKGLRFSFFEFCSFFLVLLLPLPLQVLSKHHKTTN